MIDLANEHLLSLSEVSDLLPPSRDGKNVHKSYLVRAITRGVNGVRLDAVRIGRRWITSNEALQRWMDGQTVVAGGACRQEVAAPVISGVSRRRAEVADRELRRLGV